MYLIVGLGNIGLKYKNTRHNMGFMAIDELAKRNGLRFNKKRFQGTVAEGSISGKKVVLLKPSTYMNLSGDSVVEAYRFYKPDIADVIVLYDDIDLEEGMLRVRPSGSAGTHNGMRSIVSTLKTYGFARVRIGIGKNPPYMQLADYVLQKLKGEQKKTLEEACMRAAQACETIIGKGVEKAMNDFNHSPQK